VGPALSQAIAPDKWVSNSSDFKEAANWDSAKEVSVTLGAGTLTPTNLELVAGQPYVIDIKNADTVDHGWSALEFMRASATRKVESPSSEIKMRLIKTINVHPGKSMPIFIVPVLPGVTKMEGLTNGSPTAGMTGTISVTGTAPTSPAPVIESLSTVGEVAGATNLVKAALPAWSTAATVMIEMGDNDEVHFFKPKITTLKLGVPVVMTFVNKGNVLHEYDATDLFKTIAVWKVSNAEGWVEGAVVRPADLEAGGQTSLYVIPTKSGTFTLTDSTPGMESMAATIEVVA
jgi:uncharacterized cupredoxin-like copper-binding protein